MTHDLPAERTVLEQFLSEPRWSHAGLHVKLHDLDPGTLDRALIGLLVEGVLIRDGAELWVLAPAVCHLHGLGLLAWPPDGTQAWWERVGETFDRLDEQDNPAVRYAVRRIDDPEHMAGPVVGHVEVPGAVDLMRARRAAVASGLVHDSEAFIVCEAVEA